MRGDCSWGHKSQVRLIISAFLRTDNQSSKSLIEHQTQLLQPEPHISHHQRPRHHPLHRSISNSRLQLHSHRRNHRSRFRPKTKYNLLPRLDLPLLRRLLRPRPAEHNPARHSQPAFTHTRAHVPSRYEIESRDPEHGTRVPILHGRAHRGAGTRK